jgi:hypothetical protein
MKRIWERTAEGEMNVARAMQADADDLLEKFLAAGGSYEMKPCCATIKTMLVATIKPHCRL